MVEQEKVGGESRAVADGDDADERRKRRVGGKVGESVCRRVPWKRDEGQRDRSIVCRARNGKGLDGKKLMNGDKAGWRGLPKVAGFSV